MNHDDSPSKTYYYDSAKMHPMIKDIITTFETKLEDAELELQMCRTKVAKIEQEVATWHAAIREIKDAGKV